MLQQHMVSTPLAIFAAQAAQATSRSAPRLRLLKSPVTLTEAAAGRIKQLLNKRQKVGPAAVLHMTSCFCESRSWCIQDCTVLLLELQPVSIQEYLKLGIKRRGCNGLAYTLNYSGSAAMHEAVQCPGGCRYKWQRVQHARQCCMQADPPYAAGHTATLPGHKGQCSICASPPVMTSKANDLFLTCREQGQI